MSFWNDPPDDLLGEDSPYRWDVLNRNCDLGREPYEYGGLLFHTVGGKDGIHSAVQVADGIVFGKNGTSIIPPWMLMKPDRMKAYFETETELQILACRRHKQEGDRESRKGAQPSKRRDDSLVWKTAARRRAARVTEALFSPSTMILASLSVPE